MKRILATIIATLSIAGVSVAGPTAGTTEFSPVIAGNFPTGDMGDGGKAGVGFGGDFGYYANEQVQIGAMLRYNIFGVDDFTDTLLQGVNFDYTVTGFGAYAKILFGQSERTRAFVRGSFGAYTSKLTASVSNVSIAVDATDFGFGSGVGVQFYGQGSMGGFVEVGATSVLTEGSSSNYFSVTGGLTIRLGGE